ncbi:MAG: hypothetical protein HY293_01405 [Planctomycetes bacterium]|nr:hypothetical protein [Planctomycetota bacterium]
MGLALLILGIVLALGGHIGIVVAAFREGALWGLGCLLVPIVGLIFVVTHWAETKKPFLFAVAGNVLWIAGAAMSGPSH